MYTCPCGNQICGVKASTDVGAPPDGMRRTTSADCPSHKGPRLCKQEQCDPHAKHSHPRRGLQGVRHWPCSLLPQTFAQGLSVFASAFPATDVTPFQSPCAWRQCLGLRTAHAGHVHEPQWQPSFRDSLFEPTLSRSLLQPATNKGFEGM